MLFVFRKHPKVNGSHSIVQKDKSIISYYFLIKYIRHRSTSVGTNTVIFVPVEIIFQNISSIWNLYYKGPSIS